MDHSGNISFEILQIFVANPTNTGPRRLRTPETHFSHRSPGAFGSVNWILFQAAAVVKSGRLMYFRNRGIQPEGSLLKAISLENAWQSAMRDPIAIFEAVLTNNYS